MSFYDVFKCNCSIAYYSRSRILKLIIPFDIAITYIIYNKNTKNLGYVYFSFTSFKLLRIPFRYIQITIDGYLFLTDYHSSPSILKVFKQLFLFCPYSNAWPHCLRCSVYLCLYDLLWINLKKGTTFNLLWGKAFLCMR